MSYAERLMSYLDESASVYHVIDVQTRLLKEAGYKQLKENEKWDIVPGNKYYVNRNMSSLIAFSIPKKMENVKFSIMATHSDSPCFRIKNNPDIKVENYYVKLNVEGYGGSILHCWIDRPLSVAGRIYVEGEENARLVNINRNICMIPSLAIHMNRDINKGYEWNIQKDMLALMTINPDIDLMDIIAKEAGVTKEQITGHDLYLYNRDRALRWGAEEEFIASAKLDDLASSYSSLMALIDSKDNDNSIKLHAVFDNEEVGSSTIQGACSTFLKDTMERIADSAGLSREDYHRAVADSFMLSADNAHALHPNYPDKCDQTNKPLLGKGVVVKFAGNQKYTTDGASAAVVNRLAKQCNISLQTFHNRSDMAGGSTLGNLSANQVPVSTADIGIAQLAMHSCYETIAASDVEDMVALAKQLYSGPY